MHQQRENAIECHYKLDQDEGNIIKSKSFHIFYEKNKNKCFYE